MAVKGQSTNTYIGFQDCPLSCKPVVLVIHARVHIPVICDRNATGTIATRDWNGPATPILTKGCPIRAEAAYSARLSTLTFHRCHTETSNLLWLKQSDQSC